MIAPAARRILITDDDRSVLESLSQVLRSEGYEVSTANSAEDAMQTLRREPIQLLITDMRMPKTNGLELTREVLGEWPNLPVVILTAHGTVREAVESMRLGAVDFLMKPLGPEELLIKIQKRLEEGALRTEVFRLSAQVRKTGRFGDIIGSNASMRRIFETVEQVAGKPSQVLIQGEPGTGKELIARAIHNRSLELRLPEGLSDSEIDHMRQMAELKSPYIGVNCGAFARNLLESQLFGHKRGSFTGAIADQEGVFVASQNGTLFLDEITELDLDLQVKLLRALQEREVVPVGSTRPVQFGARIITATNQEIQTLVHDKAFRPDLYWRINVVNIRVPPLRERVDDIPLLVDYFLKTIAKSYGVATREVEAPVMEVFQSYSWPGNVRELQNLIERAFALGKDEKRITMDDLPQDVLEALDGRALGSRKTDSVFPTYDQVVRDHVVRALQAAGWVKARAAHLLGIDRNRLYRLIKRYVIKQED